MTLYRHQWTPDILASLERLHEMVAPIPIPAPLWDIDNVDPSLLQWLAYDLAADAWTDILAIPVQRELLKRSWELHLYRGSEEAIHRFADMAGFAVAVTYTATGSPARNTSADIFVTPPIDRAADVTWTTYVSRVLRGEAPRLGLLPWTLTLANIFVGGSVDLGVRLGMGFQNSRL